MEFERDVEGYLALRAKAAGGMCVKFHPDTDAGMPDRIVLLPGGLTLWVELKRRGETPRPLQVFQQKRLMAVGQKVYVLDSKEAVEQMFQEVIGNGS